ncbi:MAG: peptide deformylase [Cyanobacteria bacterium HKST-UBA06]|nr:peptide deformylase [Cyanobacteria bacterium HKST-UBA05]MCA9799544.1 peptide deformylase [Cyanobacteria bacterium HKST-UBA04]MCA9807594.1 peptide deformylase [Cyanobacteria bacterium HKST-UBA06]MCA9842112.1 peptide deformylase [Cyanobacteria bacterium HKST-UBA03]
MAILKVVEYGDPVLRAPTKEVVKVSKKIQRLVDDMFDTMYAQNGCGLAAPQVGESKRIFVLDCATETHPMQPMVFINPVIVKKSGVFLSHEGCLSFPGVYIDVKRYAHVTIRAKDIKGRPFSLTPEPGTLLAMAIQHEFDHLEGILFVDHVIDRFGTDEILKAHHLPTIEPEMILDEPELDEGLLAMLSEAESGQAAPAKKSKASREKSA